MDTPGTQLATGSNGEQPISPDTGNAGSDDFVDNPNYKAQPTGSSDFVDNPNYKPPQTPQATAQTGLNKFVSGLEAYKGPDQFCYDPDVAEQAINQWLLVGSNHLPVVLVISSTCYQSWTSRAGTYWHEGNVALYKQFTRRHTRTDF